jgi:hypothetical protein
MGQIGSLLTNVDIVAILSRLGSHAIRHADIPALDSIIRLVIYMFYNKMEYIEALLTDGYNPTKI